MCLEQNEVEDHPPPTFKDFFYPAVLLLSVVFLAATLLAYCLAPEMRNLHGQCLAAHAACFLVGDLGLVANYLFTQYVSHEACYAIGEERAAPRVNCCAVLLG